MTIIITDSNTITPFQYIFDEDTLLNVDTLSIEETTADAIIDITISVDSLDGVDGNFTITKPDNSVASNVTTITLSGTQAQINAALLTLQFTPNANYNGSEILKISATSKVQQKDSNGVPIVDGNGDPIYDIINTINEDINLSITAVNDDPVLIPTTPLSVAEGQSNVGFSNAQFGLVDPDITTGQQVIEQQIVSIESLPTHGELRLNGNILQIGSVFSYDQLANLTYTHNGMDVSQGNTDLFTVKVNDGGGGESSVTNININLTPVNLAPTVAFDEFAFFEGSINNVRSPIIILGDNDDSLATSTIRIDAVDNAGQGKLYFDGNNSGNYTAGEDLLVGQTFTADQVNKIRFDSNGNEPTVNLPSYTITVTDAGGGLGVGGALSTTANIPVFINPVDDDPTIGVNAGLTVDGASTTVITNSFLRVNDVDNENKNLVYSLNSRPTKGVLQLDIGGGNWVNLGIDGLFTQQQINDGKIRYVHEVNSSNSTDTDSFSFVVRDSALRTVFPIPNEEGGVRNTNNPLDRTLQINTFDITINNPNIATGGTPSDVTPGYEGLPVIDVGTTFTKDNSPDVPDEGGFNIITTAMLNYKFVNSGVAVIPDDQVVYTIKSLPDNVDPSGGLFKGTKKLVGDSTFTQKDINDGLIKFVHHDSENFISSFDYSVSYGGEVRINDTFGIDVNPINDTPTVSQSSPITLQEGTVQTLTTAQISLNDIDGVGSDKNAGFATINNLEFQVTNLTDRGTLFLDNNNNNQLDSGEEITTTQWIPKTDLVAGKIKYLHDGTENFIDQFIIQTRDGQNQANSLSNAAVVKIDIFPVNDTPQVPLTPDASDITIIDPLAGEIGVAKNDRLTVNEGGSGGIGKVLLQAVDPDNNITQRQYRITDKVDFGKLLLNGKALGVGSTFTQKDIDDGKLTYTHNGSENFADSFKFRVSDGNQTSAEAIFEIIVTPLNDKATLTTAKNTFNIGDSTNALPITGISVRDVDLTNVAAGETNLIRVTLDPKLSSANGSQSPGDTFNNGLLALANKTGITFIDPTTGLAYTNQSDSAIGNGVALVIEGTLTAVTNALKGNNFSYAVTNDLNQQIKLNVTVDDRLRDVSGNVIGANGGLTNQNGTQLTTNPVTKIININVSTTNNAPSFVNIPNNLTVNEDTSLPLGGITVSDPDNFNSAINTVTVSVTNGKLTLTNSSLITSGTNGSGTITLTGSFSDIDAALNGLSYQGNANFNGNDTFTITATDPDSVNVGSNTVTAIRNIAVTPVNDTPTLVVPSTQYITTTNPLIFNTANGNLITIDDLADLANTGTDDFTITLTADNGTLALSGSSTLTDTNADASIITITGTKANINNALNGLSFTPSDYNTDVPINLAVSVNDNANGGTAISGVGGAITVSDNITINISDQNNAPSFVNLDVTSTSTYTENGSAIVLDNNATIIDPELSGLFNNWNGASLTLQRNGGANADDIFNTSGNLSFSGSDVIVDGTTIGTFTNTAGTLTFSFNNSATTALVNSALQQITYRNNSEDSNPSVTINYTINDGNPVINQGAGGALTGSGSITVNITPQPDAPVITPSVANPTYTENTSAVIVDSGLTLTDIDDSHMASATVSISNNFRAGDVLAVTTAGTSITAHYNTNTGVLTLTGTDSKENYEQVLKSLTFLNNTEDPLNTTRTLTYSVTDANSDNAGATTGTATRNVLVTPVNDAPTLTSTGTTTTYIENANPFSSVFSGTSISTIENGQNINRVIFTVSGINDGSNEQLSINGTTLTLQNVTGFNLGNSFTANVSLSGNIATVTITRSTSIINYQNLIDSIGYKNTSQAPTEGDRTFIISNVRDNGGTANGGINNSILNIPSTVNVIAVNDAPVLDTAINPILASTEDNPVPVGVVGSLISTFVGGISDVDGASEPNGIAITNVTNQGTLYYSIDNGANWTAITTGSLSNSNALLLANNPNTRLYFQPTPNLNGNLTNGITFRAWDQTSDQGSNGGIFDIQNNSRTEDGITSTESGGITGFSTNTDTISINITAVNDAPIATGSSVLTAVNEDTTSPAGASVTTLFSGNFSDSTDLVTGGSSANTLAGIAIVGNAANSTTQGFWQYFNGSIWTNVGIPSESSALTVTAANNLRFLPNTDYHGAIPALTVRLIDSSTTVTTGNTVNLTTIGTGGTTAYSVATVDLTTSITAVNDAPIATGTVTINNANEDTSPNGTVINTLITSSNYNDTKDNQTSNGGNNTETSLNNIAIVGSTDYVAGQGTWQYANGSGGWISIPVSGLSDTQALIIPAGREIRFVPSSNFFGTPGTLNVRLADSSSSPNASTSSIDLKNLNTNGSIGGTGTWSSGTVTINSNGITNVNDAPTIDNAATPASLANVNEDVTNPSGETISNLFGAKYNDSIDNQTGITGGGDARTALAGIAITGNGANSSTQGFWKYSLDGVTNWLEVPNTLSDNASLILPATAKLAFFPNANFNGTPGQLTVRLSDGTAFVASTNNIDLKDISGVLGGVNGWSANNTNLTTSITAVNDAPIASASSLSIEEDTANPSGSKVDSLFTGSFNDSTDQVTGGSSANSLAGVAIVGNVGNPTTEGTWQYLNNGNWVDVGPRSSSNALIVSSTDSLRFVPVANYNGAGATLTVNLIDNSSGSVTTGNTVNLSGGNATGGTTVYSGNTVLLTSEVTEGNDAPTLVVPSTQSLSSGASIIFSSGNGNAITIDDFADLSNNGVDNFTVTLNVTNGGNPYGTLALANITGLSVSGNNSATVTLTGSKANINSALNGLVYTPANSNIDLSVNLNVLVNDLGNGSSTVGQNPLTATNNVTINVSNINEAPIVTNPTTVTATEDTAFSFTGANLISFNDPDDFGSSSEVTLSVTNGALTLGTLTGLTFSTGDGTNDSSLTFRGTESALNSALASLSYQGNLNYNTFGTNKDVLNITINDLGNTGTINGVLGASNIVTRSVNISVTPVNDAPIASGNSSISSVDQNNTNPSGVSLSSLLQPNYSDVKDDQSIAIGSDNDTPLRGIAIVGNGATSAQGKWQYGITNGNLLTWYDIPTAPSDTSAFILNNSAKIRFLPNSNFNGTPGNLNIRLSDGENFPTAGSIYGAWNNQNVSTILGGSNGWSSDFIPLSTTVNRINTPPIINDLDGDIFRVAPNGITKIDQGTLAKIIDTQGLKNGGKLTISLDGLGVSINGDKLTIASSFLSGIGTIDYVNNGKDGQPLTITFNKDLTFMEWNALIQNISYTASGTVGLRTASFTVTDGENGTSNTAVAILNVSSSNILYNPPQEGDSNGVIKSDILEGTSTNDILKGKGNHDNLYGRDGNDLLMGGNENDRLDGGNGDDILFGGSGVDVLLGMAGNDYLNSGLDFDTLTGGVGADQFDYSYGKDSFLGTVPTKREYDIITDFNVNQGDKILTARSITSFNILPSTIPSLTSAGVQGVLGNGSSIAGSSPLLADSAALVKFGSRTFLVINDSIPGFDANNDIFIEFTSTGTLSKDIFSSL